MTAPNRRWCWRPPTARCSRPRTPAATGSASRGRDVKIAVLGGGAWGSVLAAVASRHGHQVVLGDSDQAAVESLARDRVNQRSVPGFRLPDEVVVLGYGDFLHVMPEQEMIVAAVPSQNMTSAMRFTAVARGSDAPPPIGMCATKGLDPERGATMAEMIALSFPRGARVGVLSGPSFAEEIARGLPAALVVASTDPGVGAAVQGSLGGDRLRIYTSSDVTGVCVGG